MKILSIVRLALVSATLPITFGTNAALVAVDLDGNAANGHEGVYDDVLDITWLRDANIAASDQFGLNGGISLGGPAIGSMNWDTAETFIAAMNAVNSGAGYLGINTWRQPTATPVNGTNYVFGTATYDGSTDQSYNLTAPPGPYNPTPDLETLGFTGSELAYHYYNNFEAIAECSGTGTDCVKYNLNAHGIHRAPDPNNYRALFDNIQTENVSSSYWAGIGVDDKAMRFRTFWGSQGLDEKHLFRHVWA
ncbi:MAG: DUF1566 domain-containing protein, partial [Gammaproteobacteria bacterium]|nr:DUF1566 domain-containing protein [Gammaproteobacteria bacterium]